MGLIGVLLTSGPVVANSSLGLSFAQGFTVLNRLQNDNDEDNALRSTTDIGVNWQGNYTRTDASLSVGVRLTGDTDNDDGTFFNDPNPRVAGRIDYRGRRLSTFATLSVVPQFRSDRQFEFVDIEDEETGAIVDVERRANEEDALQLNINARAGGSLQLDPRNSLSLSAFSRFREYPDGSETLNATRTVGATVGWNNALDSRTSGGVSFTTRLFTSDAEDADDTVSNSLSLNASRRFTPRHNANASIGLSAVDGDVGDVNVVGGVGFSYRARSDLSFRTGLDQDVAQDDNGEVRLVTRLNGSASWTVNSVSSVSFGSRLSFDTPVGGSEDDNDVNFALSAQYSLRLTEAWRLALSYGLALESSQDSVADDIEATNRFQIRLSRNFNLFP